MHRRDFLHGLLRAGAIVVALPACARAARRNTAAADPALELQLGSLMGDMERDMAGTLASVRAAGVEIVELPSPYAPFGQPRGTVRAALDAAGLRAAGTLVGTGLLYRAWDRALDAARTLGCTRVTCGAPQPEERRSARDWPELLDVYGAAAERARAAGLSFALRTEPWMFDARAGTSPLQALLDAPAARRVGIALDVGGVRETRDALADVVQRLGTRLVTAHVRAADVADAPGIAPLARLAATDAARWIITPDGGPGTITERVRRAHDAARTALSSS